MTLASSGGSKDPVSILLGCDPQVTVTLTETPSGTIFVVIAPADPTMPVGDIDGVFFNLAQDSTLTSLGFFPEANEGSMFSPVTGIQKSVDNVDTLANGAQVKDSYDVGVQFGTVDGSTEGAVPQANFTLFSETGAPLLIDELDLDSFATVVQSDGGNGQVLTVNDQPGDAPVLVDTIAIFEDFDDIHTPEQSAGIVRDDHWDVRHDALFTNGSNDGTLQLAEVETAGPVSVMFDASVNDLHNFEASGQFADSLQLQVRLDGGDWNTLDTFAVNDDKSALVGSQTGNQITETSSTLNYEGGLLDTADGSVAFRFASDISADNERIFIDNLKVTVSEESTGPAPDPVPVQEEAFAEDFDNLHALTDSANVVRSDGWDAVHDAARTDGHNDGVLAFARAETEGPAAISFDAEVNDLSRFEASGHYADRLDLQVRLDDGGWQTLDTFVVNHDKSALVGSETGNEITEHAQTLSYSGGILDDAESSVQFRFVSDISARDEKITIDNVSVETTRLDDPGEGGDAVKVDFDSGLASGDVVSDQFAGVSISAQRAGDDPDSENDAMIFDSDSPTGGDHDLEFDDQGNILIISEDNDSSDADDNAHGGTITFEFEAPSEVVSLTMLDIEEPGGTVDLFDESGELIRSIGIPTTGDGGAQELALDTTGVGVMNVNFVGSGAIDDLCYIPPADAPDDCDAQYDVHYVAGIPILPLVGEDDMPADHPDTMDDDVMM